MVSREQMALQSLPEHQDYCNTQTHTRQQLARWHRLSLRQHLYHHHRDEYSNAQTRINKLLTNLDWIGLSSVLRPLQHSIGYMGDGFYRSKDPTNSIKVLKEQIVHSQIKHTISRHEHKTQQVP